MRILLTNSPLHFSHGHTFTQQDWQTLILPYLAGIIGDKHEIKLVDNMRLFWKSNHIIKEIKDFNPEIVGFSIIASRDIFNTIRIIKQVREEYPDKILLAGGQAGTYYADWLLKSGVNFVVNKEAEKTLPELINAIESKIKNYSNIKGISYLKRGGIYKTEDRPMIKNLDECPLPRWDLMPLVKSKWFKGRYTGSIEMSRGCPFNCNFCAITAFWERKFRQKSNEKIIEELRILKSQGRTHIYLADDNFGMNAEKHAELFKMMLKENLDIKFFAQIRTDTIANNPKMIALGARAGFYGALIGFDTYDADMFNAVTKVGSKKLNIKAAKILRRNKIAIFGCHIYGLPTQKEPENFEITYKLGRKYSDLFRMPHFSPLPFTKGYEEVVEANPRQYSEVPSEEEYNKDFRPRIGNKEQQEKMSKGYVKYNSKHNWSFSEICGAIYHPNPVVRTFKRRGYIGVWRHHFYKFLRKLKLTDI